MSIKILFLNILLNQSRSYFICLLLYYIHCILLNRSKNFSNICDWFVDNDNNLNIHFGEDKTKCILFGTKQKLNKTGSLDIRYGTMQIEQYHAVTYLGCALDENISGETMSLNVIIKINYKLFCRNVFVDYFATL